MQLNHPSQRAIADGRRCEAIESSESLAARSACEAASMVTWCQPLDYEHNKSSVRSGVRPMHRIFESAGAKKTCRERNASIG